VITLHLKGTNLQIKVWQALLKIPRGRLISYEAVARKIGRPEAVRAVANAVASNPVAFLIPCHRVIRKTGVIGDYRWGSARKKAILSWEAGREEEDKSKELNP
jgi:AraC family transcriptional regulator of adaptative response/methylated-DNA-[protein]-cysteine methyltransferase